MADTQRTITELQALLADNQSAQISAQDLRDFLISARLNNITPVEAATYELTADDINGGTVHLAYTTTGVVAVSWPTALLIDNKSVTIKDVDGNSSVNNITITPESGLIDGAANFLMAVDLSAYTIYCYDGNLHIK